MARTYTTDLSSLLAGIVEVPAALDTRIHGVQLDSRLVKRGDLFVALAGAENSAETFIPQAIANGANAVLVEGDCQAESEQGREQKHEQCRVHESGDAVELTIPELRRHLGQIAHMFFKQPSNDLQVIGVTGTNGKTSVANFIAQMLGNDGLNTGVIGTLGYGFPVSNQALIVSDRTTPNVFDVHRYLAALRDQKAACVVMEVSSHGLHQGRVDGVEFDGAVFTNLTRDHLDYHGSMERYALAKQLLFQSKTLRFAVLNGEQALTQQISTSLPSTINVFEFGVGDTFDISAKQIAFDKHGISALLTTPLGDVSLKSPLIGEFNLSNLLASIGVCVAMGRSVGCIEKVDQVVAVSGRMEMLYAEGFPTVVVDYAHTPDALSNVIAAVRRHCGGRLKVVFGCGGNRDVGKRSLMAKVVENGADAVIVTDDNPRNESPESIVKDILEGFESTRNVDVIHDRERAIKQAIESSELGDVIVVAGKGHEYYQEVKGQRVAFSDLSISRRFLGLVAETVATENVSGGARDTIKGSANGNGSTCT